MTKSSMMHKSGKPRLGPLNLTQLEDMLAKASRPKDKAKIANRITIVKKQTNFGKFKVVETFK
jgi:hypothetical protein